MESSSAVLRPPLTRNETGTLLGQTMALVAATAGLFALGAHLGRDVSYQWGWLFFIAAFGVLRTRHPTRVFHRPTAGTSATLTERLLATAYIADAQPLAWASVRE